MQAGEIRQNKVSKQWVIYAPARRKRPKDSAKKGAQNAAPIPEYDPGCPFCPGNDHLVTPALFELRDPQQKTWVTKAVANKFPAVSPEAGSVRSVHGIYLAMPAHGHHEVIIETPVHNRDIGLMEKKEVEHIVEAYHRRYQDLIQSCENMMIIIFRNHGPKAGTSLVHPHSQIIATGLIPHYIRWREREADHYFDEWGRCVFCDVLREELRSRSRILYENSAFVAFIPFFAEVPFEVWIMPRKHAADFGEITDREKTGLSDTMHRIQGLLYRKLNDPDYNYIINTSAQYRAHEPQLHWYLQVRPRLTTPAGFEIGSGITINPSLPEDNAAFLKS